MKKRSLILRPAVARLARRTCADAAPAAATGGRRRRARGEVGLDDHRQRRPLLRLPLPRHLADQQEAGVPGRLRHRPRVGLLRRQLELERRQLASTTAPTSRWISTAATSSTVGDFTLRRRRPVLLLPGQRCRRHVSRSTTPSSTSAPAAGPFSVKYSLRRQRLLRRRPTPNELVVSRANGTYDLGNGFGVIAHLGYQKLKGNARVIEIGGTSPDDSVTDYKLGVTYDSSGWILGACVSSAPNRDSDRRTPPRCGNQQHQQRHASCCRWRRRSDHNACEGDRNEDGDRDRQAVQARRSA